MEEGRRYLTIRMVDGLAWHSMRAFGMNRHENTHVIHPPFCLQYHTIARILRDESRREGYIT